MYAFPFNGNKSAVPLAVEKFGYGAKGPPGNAMMSDVPAMETISVSKDKLVAPTVTVQPTDSPTTYPVAPAGHPAPRVIVIVLAL